MTLHEFDLLNYGLREILRLGVDASLVAACAGIAFGALQWGMLLRAERKLPGEPR